MFMKERFKQKKCEEGRGEKGRKRKRTKWREGRKGKRRKKKMMRDSLDPGGSGLSHFERDFLKF